MEGNEQSTVLGSEESGDKGLDGGEGWDKTEKGQIRNKTLDVVQTAVSSLSFSTKCGIHIYDAPWTIWGDPPAVMPSLYFHSRKHLPDESKFIPLWPGPKFGGKAH